MLLILHEVSSMNVTDFKIKSNFFDDETSRLGHVNSVITIDITLATLKSLLFDSVGPRNSKIYYTISTTVYIPLTAHYRP